MTGTADRPRGAAAPPTEVTLGALRRQVTAELTAAGCASAAAEARWLLEDTLELPSGGLALRGAEPVGPPARDRLAALVARRAAGEPLQYVLGWAPFGPLRLAVGPGVFVPRPETEGLADRAATHLRAASAGPPARPPVAVDLCTGSAAIACYLAHTVPAAWVLATELDPAAAAWARRNAAALPGPGRVEILDGDLDAPLPETLAGRVDVLTVNPPYVPSRAIVTLPADVRGHEPRRALDGGDDGLDVLRRVTARAGRWLRPGGHFLCEIGDDQAAPAVACVRAAGLTAVSVRPDLAGRDRVLEAVWM